MALSARNRLEGTVTSITSRGRSPKSSSTSVGATKSPATITSGSVERLGLAEGDETTAVVKASDVLLSN
ncbi:TOBE domain-containing protein [Halomarina oriensis]|uniref:Molybdenum-pterin-binding protein n=1 Tax=Halomarina oriensis TaxID=671145 RepID=A0A6B0GH21_9EURY|nr:TOBE domain-containing protein [Halomarina oriensis]MWG33071.1 molybdenum-pterin-binding protein [Halomarina oriensis]